MTDQAIISTFKQGNRTYEQRLNDCGKLACRKCGGPDRRKPSHGPYWYLCISIRRSWTRLYLGKECDTTRFVDAAGGIDWEAVKEHRARKMSTIAHRPPTNRLERPLGEQTTLSDTYDPTSPPRSSS
jgi:hypothetical protein